MFKQEFEFLTSNTKISYPFVDRVATPSSVNGEYFSDLVSDAYLVYTPGAVSKNVKLTAMSEPTGSAVECEFRFEDNTLAFEDTEGVASTFGSWTMVEWTNTTGSARILLLTSKIADYTWPVAPEYAFLVTHILQEVMPTVSKVVAIDGVTSYNLGGDIELEAGYNIDISEVEAPESARGRTRLQIAAIPGAGAGASPECTQIDSILTINGVGGDANGNLTLHTEDCYRLEYPIDTEVSPGVWRETPNQLTIYNQCEPCCQCEDYVYLYDILLRTSYDEAKLTSDYLYAVLDQYKDLRDRIIAEKAAREKLLVEVRPVAKQGWTTSAQVVVYNNTPDNITDVELEVHFSAGATGILVPGTAVLHNDQQQRQDAPISGTFPTYLVDTALDINFTKLLVLTFEIYFPETISGVENPRAAGMSITVTANGQAGSSTLLEASGTTYMLAPFNKE
jgi:hypothetical protein